MNNLLIGSTAIKHWFPDFKREPSDVDYIVRNDEPKVKGEKRIELLANPVFDDYPHDIMLPDDLLTLKMSHVIGWDIKWDKHMFDIQFLIGKGCKVNIDLFNRLYEYWNELHGENRRSDLDMTAEEFFDNALTYPVGHDLMHTIINPIPTYTKVLKDGAEVETCGVKFEALTHEEKCDLVREEVYIMAIERYRNMDYRVAYAKMLKKFILNHAPIWEGIFIMENFIELHRPKINYYKVIEESEQFKNALQPA